MAVLQRFVQRVRAHPITGKTHDGDGAPVTVTVNEDALVQTVMDAEAVPPVYRNLLGAVLSAEHGDNAPILRTVAENITVDAPNGPKRDFSEALYAAVVCHDYLQPWSLPRPFPGAWPRRWRGSMAATRAVCAVLWSGVDRHRLRGGAGVRPLAGSGVP